MMKIILLVIALSGCGMLYTNVHVPRSYRSATPADVKCSPADNLDSAEACNYSLVFLFAWGNGGYAGGAEAALKNDPEGILYDVKADSRVKSILGLYTRYCTILTGRVGKP